MQRPTILRWLVFALAMTVGGDARAEAIVFGPRDVETVFFVTKSSDRNRVDYGIRLSERCAPVNDDAMFPYWRDFGGVAAGADALARLPRLHPVRVLASSASFIARGRAAIRLSGSSSFRVRSS